MHSHWILLCMSLYLLSYASLINKEGIGMRNKSKGGLASSIPRPVAGWVCYSLVSKLLVETLGRVCWSESRGRDQTLTMNLKISGGMALQNLDRRRNVIDPL
jgi:hypothetical protein